MGSWAIKPTAGDITAGGFQTHLSGKNLVATDITFTLAAPTEYYYEEVCPFSQDTTMEVVGPFTVQWRQMNGRYYRNEVRFWSSDNHRAEVRTDTGATYDAKVGIFFPGNWNVNSKNVNNEGKKAVPGFQVEVAPHCLYSWTDLRKARGNVSR